MGRVNSSNWQNAEFELIDTDVKSWDDLSRLQISLKTLSVENNKPVIYLDSVYVEAQYENMKEESNLPKVLIKDPSAILIGKQDFSLQENPSFVINDPELSVADINLLIKYDQAEIVEDKGDVFDDNSSANPLPVLDNLKNVVEPIIHTTDNEVKNITSFLGIQKVFAETTGHIIDVKVLDPSGNETDINTSVNTVNVSGEEREQVTINKPTRNFRPGIYKLRVSLQTPETIIISEQDFSWGVLSINVNKSTYQVGDNAYIQMGVLNDAGHTICNADLSLDITSPNGSVQHFDTNNNSIVREPACGPDNFIDVR